MATVVINVAPCYANEKPLSEEFFVDDPSELLGKDYHYKVSENHLVQHSKQHLRKVLPSSFHLNGHTLGFHLRLKT